jgi:hypothetical protein
MELEDTEARNDTAGEGQQQFNRPTDAVIIRQGTPWTTQVKFLLIVVLGVYGCETWSLTLREEHRLRVFENRVLRRIFGPKRE